MRSRGGLRLGVLDCVRGRSMNCRWSDLDMMDLRGLGYDSYIVFVKHL
jgi:hypothetical protein